MAETLQDGVHCLPEYCSYTSLCWLFVVVSLLQLGNSSLDLTDVGVFSSLLIYSFRSWIYMAETPLVQRYTIFCTFATWNVRRQAVLTVTVAYSKINVLQLSSTLNCLQWMLLSFIKFVGLDRPITAKWWFCNDGAIFIKIYPGTKV